MLPINSSRDICELTLLLFPTSDHHEPHGGGARGPDPQQIAAILNLGWMLALSIMIGLAAIFDNL